MSTLKVDTITTISGTGNITLSRPIVGDGSNLTGVAPTKATVEALGIDLPAANLTGTIHADRYTDTVYTHPTTAGNKHIPTAGATDQVLTYSSSGTASWADPAGGGLSDVSLWSQPSDQSIGSASNAAISGWTEANEPFYVRIGSAMTHSSGIFTFPSTGTWEVHWQMMWFTSSPSQNVAFLFNNIDFTANNGSSWSSIKYMSNKPGSETSYYNWAELQGCITVAITDVANDKVRISSYNSDTFKLAGAASQVRSGVLFSKISDTYS